MYAYVYRNFFAAYSKSLELVT